MMCESAGEGDARTGLVFRYLHTFWPSECHTRSKFAPFSNCWDCVAWPGPSREGERSKVSMKGGVKRQPAPLDLYVK